MLTVKLPPARLEEFKIAAMLRGTTMSSLVQQFVTQVVREEMSIVPQAFKRREGMGIRGDNLIDLIDPDSNQN